MTRPFRFYASYRHLLCAPLKSYKNNTKLEKGFLALNVPDKVLKIWYYLLESLKDDLIS